MMIITNKTIVIVGAGLSGATLARKFAEDGKQIVVFEKRDHIGGNTYDYRNEDGIMIAKYGAHIFHTSDQEVWDFVNRFTEWIPYEHRVLSRVGDKLVPVPVNIDTVNELFGTQIRSPREMETWLFLNTTNIKKPRNSEESALARVGGQLYELMFKNYTKKQWDMEPRELEPEVMARIPVRTDHNDRYFSDTYEGIPKEGYTEMVKKMLDHENIQVVCGIDYFGMQPVITPPGLTIFTGKIDQYFGDKHGKLEYRSLRFEHETLDIDSFQPAAVVNYPEEQYPFTRIIEHKKFYNQKSLKTSITREYSIAGGEPYYPIPNKRNRDIFNKYQKEARRAKKVVFAGRLANYKYFNMDQAIKNALEIYEEVKGKV